MIDKTIDPARSGLSKSLFATPCEKQGYYKERVRDEKGRSLSFPMPERVLFGRAIDAAHAFIVWHDREGADWTVEAAVRDGLQNATTIECSEVYDPTLFVNQVTQAMSLFVTAPDGLTRMRQHYDGLRFQGDNGRSLTVEDVVGTPDYLTPHGVIDVKATGSLNGYGKQYVPDKFYRSPEMPTYAWLYAAENGSLPAFLAYQVCVRQKSGPSWQWIETAGSSALVDLGKAYANRWRKGLALDDPDLFAADTYYCGECPFREAIEGTTHGGCTIGQLVHEIGPKEATQ